jgi:hypothetical protein
MISLPTDVLRYNIDPANPHAIPHSADNARTMHSLIGSLKAKGTSIPGIGEAVPGALLMIPKDAAIIPENPPAKKLHEYIGIAFFVTRSAWVSGSSITASICPAFPMPSERNTIPLLNAPPNHATDAIPMGSPLRSSIAVRAMLERGDVQTIFMIPPRTNPMT